MDSASRFLYALWDTTTVQGPLVICGGTSEVPDETPARIAFAQTLGVDLFFPRGENTFDEAQDTARVLDGPACTLITHSYHLPRAYLTYLQAFRRHGKEVQLWARGVPGDLTKLQGELEKIALYQKRGHLASYEDGLESLTGLRV